MNINGVYNVFFIFRCMMNGEHIERLTIVLHVVAKHASSFQCANIIDFLKSICLFIKLYPLYMPQCRN